MRSGSKLYNLIFRYIIITLGCAVYSFGVAMFLDSNNIASGGVTGIAIIVNYLTGLHTGLLIILINIPLLILGAFFFGKYFTISTVYSTVVSSLMIEMWNFIFKDRLIVTENMLLPAVVGGTLFGIGLALIFRMGSTTGGTDIVVKILRKKFRYIKTGIISMTIDIIIIGVSALIYRDFELTCYTVISIIVTTALFDWVLYGGSAAKLVYIITTQENATPICERLLKELDVGATYVDGEGAYTGKEKRIILCAIKNFLYPKLRDTVRDVDPHAFTIVTSAKEIYGEGYKNHSDDEL